MILDVNPAVGDSLQVAGITEAFVDTFTVTADELHGCLTEGARFNFSGIGDGESFTVVMVRWAGDGGEMLSVVTNCDAVLTDDAGEEVVKEVYEMTQD